MSAHKVLHDVASYLNLVDLSLVRCVHKARKEIDISATIVDWSETFVKSARVQ